MVINKIKPSPNNDLDCIGYRLGIRIWILIGITLWYHDWYPKNQLFLLRELATDNQMKFISIEKTKIQLNFF
jgi:hypothetical protein